MQGDIQIPSEVLQRAVDNRRHFHKHPELSYKEENTSKYILEYLKPFGLSVVSGIAKTGIVATLTTGREGPCILIRADMDALPLTETTKHEFRSQNEGVHHACGHDGHMAILLGTIEMLCKDKENLCGTLKFIFQPAEEGGAGARAMIEDKEHDILKGVDECYGLHLFTPLKVGKIGVANGAVSAFSNRFLIKIKGKGGHGSMPQDTIDPIRIGSALVEQINQIISRDIDPTQSAVISIGVFKSGTGLTIIPSECDIQGTIRTFSRETFDKIKTKMTNICRGLEIAHGAEINLDILIGYPPTINSKKETQFIKTSLESLFGEENIEDAKEKFMIGEDFAFFLEKRPGSFFIVGACPDDCWVDGKTTVPHHSPQFNFDERALEVGMKCWLQIVYDRLRKKE